MNIQELIPKWKEEFKRDDSHQDQWRKFAELVTQHIINYANAQYGNKNKQWVEMDEKQCRNYIEKYCLRMATGVRGPDQRIQDMFKIADFAMRRFIELVQEAEEA